VEASLALARLREILGLLRMYYEEFVDALSDYQRGAERIYAVERLAQLIAQALLGYAAVLASQEKGVKPRYVPRASRVAR